MLPLFRYSFRDFQNQLCVLQTRGMVYHQSLEHHFSSIDKLDCFNKIENLRVMALSKKKNKAEVVTIVVHLKVLANH